MDTDMKILKDQLTEASTRETQFIIRESELKEQISSIQNENKRLDAVIANQKIELQHYRNKEAEYLEELNSRHMMQNNKSNSPKKILYDFQVIHIIYRTFALFY